MPVDVRATVLSNVKLSDDYSVLALEAPSIAAAVAPGQFVMVKPAAGIDPLLRRPFSVFEVLRDREGTPTAFTLLNKRVGAGTGLLYRARPGDRLACLGPLGLPFATVDPPALAWMIAGGVGLAPFATLGEALVARGTPATLFYGARRASELHRADVFERLGIRTVFATEDGSLGERGFVTAALERALVTHGAHPAIQLYACGPTAMMRAVAALAARYDRPCSVSLEQVMGCGLGGCYSCVVRVSNGGTPHYVRSCIGGPVFDARRIVWDAVEH